MLSTKPRTYRLLVIARHPISSEKVDNNLKPFLWVKECGLSLEPLDSTCHRVGLPDNQENTITEFWQRSRSVIG